MGYRFLADAVALVHLAFVLFIPLGGLAVLRWPRLAWVHLVSAVWGALILWTDLICPLTPLEKTLRSWGGDVAYEGGFIRHYLVGPVFTHGLPSGVAMSLFAAGLLLNGWAYRQAVRRRWRVPG